MILGMSVATFVIVHVVISLIAIVAGLIVMFGMLGSNRMPGLTAIFLLFTILTSATGFVIPPLLTEKLLPSHLFGILSLILLAIACFALYSMKLAGAWRWIYVVTALLSLYLNVLRAGDPGFLKIPALTALAPGNPPAGPSFAVAQGIVLVFFVVMIIGAWSGDSARRDIGRRLSFRRERQRRTRSARVDCNSSKRRIPMPTITTKDGVEIFYKDWGKGQPIVFSHGWPLSSDDWDTQMLFFLNNGFRVIAHDRRGHGRSSQVGDGHDMDHYADDLAALTAHLDLKNAVHVGHSTGGGEVVHYIARHGESRVAKAAILSAVPPLMVQTPANPGGLPKEVFDGIQAQLAANRSEFYRALPSGPFYGYNRPGAKPSEAIIQNWWRQGMMGGAKAHYDGIVAFSQTDFTEDLKKITVPVLVMHGDDDQIVPYADSAPLSAKLLKNGTLKTYKGFPHGMPTTEAATINADLLAFIKS